MFTACAETAARRDSCRTRKTRQNYVWTNTDSRGRVSLAGPARTPLSSYESPFWPRSFVRIERNGTPRKNFDRHRPSGPVRAEIREANRS